MIEARIADLVDRAFDYRGYVTLRRSDGSEGVGFIYDRGTSHVELLDQSATRRMRVPLAEIADIAFTGEDAARKSQEIWERRKGTLEPRDTPAHGDWAEAGPVLVLVALEQELRAVGRALDGGPRTGSVRGRLGGNEVVTLACGMGKGPGPAFEEWQPRLVVTSRSMGSLRRSPARWRCGGPPGRTSSSSARWSATARAWGSMPRIWRNAAPWAASSSSRRGS